MSVGRLIAATSAALGLWLGTAVAQVPQGRIYVLHSPAAGACPSLDWHIVVEPNDILAGLIAWDDMKTMARATGKVDRPNHTFSMTAVEMGGQGRTATVDGKVEKSGTIIANINGPNVTCKSVTVRTYRVPADGK
jgi:hypothetical protein